MNNIEEVKARIDIVDLVSESVQLRRSGKNYMGFCPFHDNKRTPAFAVFPESGIWRCFGQCNEGGDVFKFVMKKEGWDFAEALRHLASRAGVQLRQPTPQEEARQQEYDRLRDLLEDAVTFFRHHLHNTAAGQDALSYLQDRKLDEHTIETWGLGYAPDGWDHGLRHFRENGYQEADLLASGLASQADSGKIFDRFRNRILFPIRDPRGRMAGFGARTLDPDGLPKYLNSPQTDLFDKGRMLYGLDQAGAGIRDRDQAVIVEGYLDVIALHKHGFENAVSPMGTALTEHQLRLLKRRTRNIVLALDSDAAGNNATLRGLQLARQTFDRQEELAFDARGLLHKEARLRADIRVTVLPEGLDPDEVVNRDPQEWLGIMQAARPIVVHVMETLAGEQDLSDPKVKREIADQVLPLIEDLPDSIERETYRQRLARMLRIDERALGIARPLPRRRPVRRPAATRPPETHPRPGAQAIGGAETAKRNLEAYCLGVLLRHPDLIYRLDRALQKAGLNRLSPQDFQDSGHQAIMHLIQESLAQDFAEPIQVVLGSLPLSLMEQADSLLANTEILDPNEARVLEDLMRTVLDMRRKNVSQNIHHLRFLMEDAQEKGELIVQQYQKTMLQHIGTLNRLDLALRDCIDRTIFVG